MTTGRVAGIALIVMGIATGALFSSGRAPNPFVPVGALFMLLAGASFFGKATRFAQKLQPFVGKNVWVLAWGAELPSAVGSTFKVVRIHAIGPGLHFYLCPIPHGSSTHLKVAQPLETTISENMVQIGHAKYIQWAGRKVNKTEREKALVLTLAE